jgi:hypothetical protein
MLKIIGYILIWLAVIYQAIVNPAKSLAVIAISMGVLPFVSLGFACLLLFGIKATLSMEELSAEVKEAENLIIKIRNDSFLPIGRGTIYLNFTYGQEKVKKEFKINFAITAREEAVIRVPITAEYCGIANVTISKLKVRVLLISIWKKMKHGGVCKVTILPIFRELPLRIGRKNPFLISDSDRYQDGQAGNDASEIFQVREYRPGDKLQRIHWKLTAKKDQLLVKDYSLPIDYDTLILLDFSQVNQQYFHILVQSALSLSWSFIALERQHMIAWFDQEYQKAVCHYIDTEENVYEMLRILLSIKPVKEPEALNETLKLCRNHQFNRILTLTTPNHKIDLNLKENGCLALKQYLLAAGEELPLDYLVPDAMKTILINPKKLDDSLNEIALMVE